VPYRSEVIPTDPHVAVGKHQEIVARGFEHILEVRPPFVEPLARLSTTSVMSRQGRVANQSPGGK